jgi:hypothetical protein
MTALHTFASTIDAEVWLAQERAPATGRDAEIATKLSSLARAPRPSAPTRAHRPTRPAQAT